jgi:hypothetical protein
MERHEPPLDIRAGTHLFGRAKQYPHPPCIDGIEEQLLGSIGLGVVDERDLGGGDACLDELRTDIVVDVEALRIGGGKVAEDELRRASLTSRVPLPGPRVPFSTVQHVPSEFV